MLTDAGRTQRQFDRLKGSLRARLVRNVLALYSVRAFEQLLPLFVLWYLTGMLSLEGMNLFLFANAFAMYGIAVVEYGFIFSGTRAVARARGQPQQLVELVSATLVVPLMLAVVVALCAGAARYIVPTFQGEPLLLWAALSFAILQGLSRSGTSLVRSASPFSHW